jgi:hypothetical protein
MRRFIPEPPSDFAPPYAGLIMSFATNGIFAASSLLCLRIASRTVVVDVLASEEILSLNHASC